MMVGQEWTKNGGVNGQTDWHVQFCCRLPACAWREKSVALLMCQSVILSWDRDRPKFHFAAGQLFKPWPCWIRCDLHNTGTEKRSNYSTCCRNDYDIVKPPASSVPQKDQEQPVWKKKSSRKHFRKGIVHGVRIEISRKTFGLFKLPLPPPPSNAKVLYCQRSLIFRLTALDMEIKRHDDDPTMISLTNFHENNILYWCCSCITMAFTDGHLFHSSTGDGRNKWDDKK